MSYQTERDNFMRASGQWGIPADVARKLMRHATTLQRLAEAMCNGDWPADNGERKLKTCPQCEVGWAPASFARGLCPDCRAEDLLKKTLANVPGLLAETSGDPRGAVVKIFKADTTPEDRYCGRAPYLPVPTRY